MTVDPQKAIRRASIIARGIAHAVGPVPSGGTSAPHPASLLPGVHVRAMEPHAFAAGGDTGEGGMEPTDETGFDAWHGSPHLFAPEPDAPLGRFKNTAIGTGEGAQAYGHGHYLAESRPVAEGYKKDLSSEVHVNDEPFLVRGKKVGTTGMGMVDDIISMHHGDVNKIINEINDPLSGLTPQEREYLSKIKDKIQNKVTGHLYHVRVRANPEHFLDWDKPIHHQPNTVKEIIRSSLKRNGYLRDKDNGDRQLMSALKAWNMERGSMYEGAIGNMLSGKSGLIADTPEKTSTALHAAGIPGIRYLDAGSRGIGKGTHNYVIFDPNIIDIKHRYARGGDVMNYKTQDDIVHRALHVARHHAPLPGQRRFK